MAANRLVSILLRLQARGHATASELANEFGVSVRTIHRDIDQMSATGIPVYADRGRAGGFRLVEGYRTRLGGFTQPEAQSLFLAGLPGPAADLGLTDLLATARTKLMAALPPGIKPNAERIVARFHLDPAAWFRSNETVSHLPQIAQAVWNERYLKISYRRSSGIRSRTLGPLGLVLKGGVWYLVAQSVDGNSSRLLTYRATHIIAAEVTTEAFARPKNFDLAAHWRESSRAYEEGVYQGSVDVRLSPRGRQLLDVLGQYVLDQITATAGVPDRNGWIRCTFPIESTDSGVRELMRLARDVEVLGPPEFKAQFRSTLREVSASYSGAPTAQPRS